MGLTIARRPRTRRLNSVDLPALARPTSTTTGAPSGKPARAPVRPASAAGFISQPQLRDFPRVLRPVFFDFHQQLQKYSRAERLLELQARRRPDLLQLASARPNQHPLVRLAGYDDQRFDPEEPAIRFFFDEVFHRYGSRKGDLLPHREKNLLPDYLSRDHPLGLVGVFVLGHQGGSLGERSLDHRH